MTAMRVPTSIFSLLPNVRNGKSLPLSFNNTRSFFGSSASTPSMGNRPPFSVLARALEAFSMTWWLGRCLQWLETAPPRISAVIGKPAASRPAVLSWLGLLDQSVRFHRERTKREIEWRSAAETAGGSASCTVGYDHASCAVKRQRRVRVAPSANTRRVSSDSACGLQHLRVLRDFVVSLRRARRSCPTNDPLHGFSKNFRAISATPLFRMWMRIGRPSELDFQRAQPSTMPRQKIGMKYTT